MESFKELTDFPSLGPRTSSGITCVSTSSSASGFCKRAAQPLLGSELDAEERRVLGTGWTPRMGGFDWSARGPPPETEINAKGCRAVNSGICWRMTGGANKI